MEKLVYYFIYFFVFSVVGYICEVTYVYICDKKLVNRGFLHGPYIPIYGFGAVILITLSPSIQHSYLLTFIVSTLCLSTLEYMTSLFLEIIFHCHIWDYSHYPCNYHGRICLFYSILWGFLSMIFIYYIHPYLSSFITCNTTTSLLS